MPVRRWALRQYLSIGDGRMDVVTFLQNVIPELGYISESISNKLLQKDNQVFARLYASNKQWNEVQRRLKKPLLSLKTIKMLDAVSTRLQVQHPLIKYLAHKYDWMKPELFVSLEDEMRSLTHEKQYWSSAKEKSFQELERKMNAIAFWARPSKQGTRKWVLENLQESSKPITVCGLTVDQIYEQFLSQLREDVPTISSVSYEDCANDDDDNGSFTY